MSFRLFHTRSRVISLFNYQSTNILSSETASLWLSLTHATWSHITVDTLHFYINIQKSRDEARGFRTFRVEIGVRPGEGRRSHSRALCSEASPRNFFKQRRNLCILRHFGKVNMSLALSVTVISLYLRTLWRYTNAVIIIIIITYSTLAVNMWGNYPYGVILVVSWVCANFTSGPKWRLEPAQILSGFAN